jgi:hypothetical protein
VAVDVKIISLEKLGHIIIGFRVDQDSANNSLFGFAAMGDQLRSRRGIHFADRELTHGIPIG